MKLNHRTASLTAGLSLVIMALAAGFSYGYVQSGLVVPGQPEATLANMTSGLGLFRAGLAGWALIFLTDLLVTVSLWFYFRETRPALALATAGARFVYTLMLGVALVSLFSLPALVREPVGDAIRTGLVASALESFERTWSLGLIVFGFHLLGLGVLSLGHRDVPALFGILLLVAGGGYLAVHGSKALPGIPLASAERMEQILMLPMALGEVLFAFWLIVRGGRPKKTRMSVEPASSSPKDRIIGS